MKKKRLLLPLLGLTALSSCAPYGQEINDKAEIQELENAVTNRMNEIQNYEAVINCTHRDNLGSISEGNVIYRVDQKNKNHYLHMSYKDNNTGKNDLDLYEVEDKDYGKVGYWENHLSDGKTDANAYYAVEYGFNFLVPSYAIGLLEYFYQACIPSNIEKGLSTIETPVSSKYYSKGQGNLTIEITSNEVTNNGNATYHSRVTYSDYVFESAKIENQAERGNQRISETYDISFKEFDSPSITLPDGWQNYFHKAA